MGLQEDCGKREIQEEDSVHSCQEFQGAVQSINVRISSRLETLQKKSASK